MVRVRASGRTTGGALGLLAAALAATALAGCDEDGEPASRPPNVVVIQSDDQGLDLFTRQAMPATYRELVDDGTRLRNYITTTPLCCPSRASLLTGQYGHNNGVLANKYSLLRDKDEILPAWLQHAGYRTIHVGKYLNNYDSFAGMRKPAFGWTDWQTISVPAYYDYDLSDNGELIHYGTRDRDYSGRVITRRAARAVRESAGGEPFYLQVDYYQPHSDPGRGDDCAPYPIPDPRDFGSFADADVPRPPSFDERDMSDKPAFAAGLPPLDAGELETVAGKYRCGLAASRSLDRGVERIVDALRESGELDRTVVVYVSDNGVLHGQHRVPSGKHVAYEEAIRVPGAIRVPPGVLDDTAPANIDAPTANIDLAPTILDLAGASPCIGDDACRVMDGLSMAGSLGGPGSPVPRNRALLLELDEEQKPPNRHEPCRYAGVVTPKAILIQYSRAQDAAGNCVPVEQSELYDREDDPYQLDNLTSDGSARTAALVADLRTLLAELRDCAGIDGRDQRVGDRPYCGELTPTG